MAQFDIDDDEYARQQAFANTLRKQAFTPGEMRGRIYAHKDPLAAFAEAAAGGFVSSKATSDRQAIEDQRNQQVKDWMGRMPSDPTLAPREQAAALQKHAMEGFEMKSPLAQTMAQSGMQRAMAMPEKEAEMADRNAQRQLELTLRNQQSKDLQSERLAQQASQAQEGRALRMTLAQMAQGNRGANNDLQRQLLEMRIEGQRAKNEAPAKPSVRAEKEAAGVSELLEKITAAEQGLPHYSGAGTVVPSIVRQAYTSPQTKMADANMGALAAEKAHELYGAAFTAAERNRAAQFLPDIGDTTDTAKAKLAALRRIAEKKQARVQGKPDPHPNMYGDILDPSGSAPASGAPTVVRTGTRNGVKVEQLSDGTVREVR